MKPYSEDRLRELADGLLPEVINLRRRFHRHPELGMEEYRTAGDVADYLRDVGLDVQTEVGGTGVVGLLRGDEPGRTVALRADMDALPIQEETGAEYASEVAGKMHACGHDAHTANLLGTARILSELTGNGGRLRGNVKFLFQPAEEGPGGAEPMIRDGALDSPPVDAVLGLHVNSERECGEIVVKSGVVTAAADSAIIDVIGSGGHGAHPDKAVDSIVVAAQVVTALQTVVSREVGPTDSAVVTVGRIEGGFRNNVIAPSVRMEATIRSLEPEVRTSLRSAIERIVSGVTGSMRANYEMQYDFGYPSLHNDEEMVGLVGRVTRDLLGEDALVQAREPSMGAEDFSYFASEVPGCFFRLGVRNEEEGLGMYPAHNSRFDLDESALRYGMMVMAASALTYLHQSPGG